jgi:hypothetical protein
VWWRGAAPEADVASLLASMTPQKGEATMTTKKVVHRNAGNGKFVTKRYADNHPRTTEREHVYVPAPKTTPKK